MVAPCFSTGKMIRKVSRHNKLVVEMLNVFGAKTTKCFKGDFPAFITELDFNENSKDQPRYSYLQDYER